jgi:starvation-inducible DNA-binding protein
MNTAEQLTQIFKDNFVTYFRSHVAHVNITGRNFRSDHKLLEGVYTRRQDQIDRIGELLRSIDEYMPCDISEILETSHIDIGELSGSADYLLGMVEEDLEHLVEEFRDLIVIADADGHDAIANYAQDQVLDLDKSIWMLKATLGETKEEY